VQFVLRTNPRRETSPEATRRSRKRRKNFSRQILNTGPTAVGSARSCTTVSRVERTGVISTCEVAKSRRHLDRPIKRHVARSYPIAKSGIGSWRSKSILSPKNSDTRNREIPKRSQPSISQDRWQQIIPSAFRSSGFSKSIATKDLTRNSRNPDTRNPDKILAVRFSGHVASIAAPVGISEFGVSSCQRNLTSQLAKSRYAKPR
jgi:hypothetical protein